MLILVRKNKRWALGDFTGMSFLKIKDIEDPSSIKGEKIALKKILKGTSEGDVIFNEFNESYLFIPEIVNMPNDERTEEEIEDSFFEYINKKCLVCEKTCKQSREVEIIKCPDRDPSIWKVP